jgi:DNA modification methylase
MAERAARSSAREGEIVGEPFGGTGATLMGCEAAGRRCFAMELEPVYVDVIVRRWQQKTGAAALLEGGEGVSFASLEAQEAAA